MVRYLALTALSAVCSLGLSQASAPQTRSPDLHPAQAQVAPPQVAGEGSMAIRIPAGATVTAEGDMRDEDIIGFLKNVLSNNLGTMPMGKSGKGDNPLTHATFQVGPANSSVTVNFNDIAQIVRNIHRVHFVAYTAPEKTATLAFYEQGFHAMGMHRMFYLNNDDGHLLVMAGQAPNGLAVVSQTDNEAFVVRVDGMIDLSLLGKIVNQAATSYFANAGAGATAHMTPAAPAKPAHPASKASAAKLNAAKPKQD